MVTPLVITILMIFVSLIFCIRNYDLSQKICIQHSLTAQSKLKISLEKLLQLNPTATYLRNLYKKLRLLYTQAIKTKNPILASILKAKMKIIHKKRVFLDRKQKSILNQSVKDLEASMNSFRKKIMKFYARRIQKDHYKPIPLAVMSRPKGDIAPNYYVLPNFSFRQRLLFSWQMPLHRFLPKWIEEIFFEPNFSSYRCSATLKKRGINWVESLTKKEVANAFAF